jgi:hypothetical protein
MKIWYLLPLLTLAFGCATVEKNYKPITFEGKPLFDLNEVQCPRDMVKYCQGPNRKNLNCECVSQQSVSQAFDFLR